MTHSIALIKREMKKRHMSSIELSRLLGLHQTTVHSLLKRDTIKVERVAQLCKVFQYNFFRELAEQFPFEQPVFDNAYKQKEVELNKEIDRLKDENKTLNIQVDLLKEVIEKIG